MRNFQKAVRLLTAGLLFSGLCMTVFAQAPQAQDDKNQRDRAANGSAITGCLSKDTSGGYVIADEKTGAKTTVMGSTDLEKHSANHKVTLTGAAKSDPSGKQVFEVSKVTHVSDSCKAPE
jgi:hypothetical protein